MAQEVYLKRRGGALIPDDDHSAEIIARLDSNKRFKVELKQDRNARQHRLFFGLLNIVYPSTHYESFDMFLVSVKIATGHVDTVIMKGGKVAFIPKSISFAKMSQTEFKDFFDRATHYLVKNFVPHMTDEQLQAEVYEMLGEKREAA